MKIVELLVSVASALGLGSADKALAQDKKSCAYSIRSDRPARPIRLGYLPTFQELLNVNKRCNIRD